MGRAHFPSTIAWLTSLGLDMRHRKAANKYRNREDTDHQINNQQKSTFCKPLSCIIMVSRKALPLIFFGAPFSSSFSPSSKKTSHALTFNNCELKICSFRRSSSPFLPLHSAAAEKSNFSIDKVQAAAIEEFTSTLLSSLEDGTFTAFTLKGPSAPRKKKNIDSTIEENNRLMQQKEKLRGKYKFITGRLVLLQNDKKKAIKENNLHLQANIKFHLATDVAQNWNVANNEVHTGLQRLFATAIGIDTKDVSTDAIISEWGRVVQPNNDLGIISGELVTTQGVYKLILQPSRKAGFFKTKQKQPCVENNRMLTKAALAHDRPKNVPLSPSSLFFQKLGVTNADGKPVNGMSSKLRQCQKFVEIVGKLVDDCVLSSSYQQTAARVTDMGCGRGYLTFSLHSYLCSKYLLGGNGNKICSVETVGIDRRPKLIQEINGIARDLGGDFDSLKFVEGTIGDSRDNNLLKNKQLSQDDCLNSEPSKTFDILIALHACDTATDDAIYYAIARGADIIVTAPCCQHELRPQIDKHALQLSKQNHPLSEILQHAIYRERYTEIATDGMRALLLDIAGYDTKVFEFVGGEHTAKNVMITAVRRKDDPSCNNHDSAAEKRVRLMEIAKMYGVERQRLAALMGETINGENANDKMKTTSGMPPL
jgi:SAM-dependent methyltransferase